MLAPVVLLRFRLHAAQWLPYLALTGGFVVHETLSVLYEAVPTERFKVICSLSYQSCVF